MIFLAETTNLVAGESIVGLVKDLGPAAATVIAIYFFLAFMRTVVDKWDTTVKGITDQWKDTVLTINTEMCKRDVERDRRDDRLFLQLNELAKDKGQVIRDNTSALAKIDATVDRLTDVVEKLGSDDGERAT